MERRLPDSRGLPLSHIKELGFSWMQNIHGVDGMNMWGKILSDGDNGEEIATTVQSLFQEHGFQVTFDSADAADIASAADVAA